MKKTILILISTVVLIQAAAVNLQAIPAFARKYQMTCKTCHTPFPKLKPYGDEFAANGYVIKDKDAPRYTIDTGDDFLSLIRDLPLAVRLDGFATYNNSATTQFDFASPFMMKFLSGGEITKNVSYFFYFVFSEMGEIAGIEDAFLMFNNLFGSGFDFYVGQFQVSDPIFKRELRLTLEDYQIISTEVGESSATLTYDRGVMLSYDFPSQTSLTVEVVNGSGIGQANIFRNLDSDKYKNLVLRLSQDIGKDFRIGGFTYLGKEEKENIGNSLWILGADATFTVKPFEFNLQYIDRRDGNPYFAVFDLVPSENIKTRGGFAELVYLPKGDDSKWYLAGLYNWVNSDLDVLDYSSATVHYGRMLRRNIRATAEFTYVFDSIYRGHGRFALGLITGF
jgi:hypothetical protein